MSWKRFDEQKPEMLSEIAITDGENICIVVFGSSTTSESGIKRKRYKTTYHETLELPWYVGAEWSNTAWLEDDINMETYPMWMYSSELFEKVKPEA